MFTLISGFFEQSFRAKSRAVQILCPARFSSTNEHGESSVSVMKSVQISFTNLLWYWSKFFDYKIVQKFSKSVPDILWVTHPFSKFTHFCSFKLRSVHGHLNVRLFLVHLMPFYVRYTRILVTSTCYRLFSTLWTLDLIEIWVTDFRITDTISTLKMSIGNIPHPMII